MSSLLDFLGLIGLILITLIGLTALMALSAVLFPGLIVRARAHAVRMPRRAFLVGLLNFAFFGLLSAALLSAGEVAALLGLIVAAILLAYVGVGLTAIADLVGERMGLQHQPPLLRTVVGAVTLQLAALTPLVGWIIVPTVAGLIGYGALIIALVRRKPAE